MASRKRDKRARGATEKEPEGGPRAREREFLSERATPISERGRESTPKRWAVEPAREHEDAGLERPPTPEQGPIRLRLIAEYRARQKAQLESEAHGGRAVKTTAARPRRTPPASLA